MIFWFNWCVQCCPHFASLWIRFFSSSLLSDLSWPFLFPFSHREATRLFKRYGVSFSFYFLNFLFHCITANSVIISCRPLVENNTKSQLIVPLMVSIRPQTVVIRKAKNIVFFWNRNRRSFDLRQRGLQVRQSPAVVESWFGEGLEAS